MTDLINPIRPAYLGTWLTIAEKNNPAQVAEIRERAVSRFRAKFNAEPEKVFLSGYTLFVGPIPTQAQPEPGPELEPVQARLI